MSKLSRNDCMMRFLLITSPRSCPPKPAFWRRRMRGEVGALPAMPTGRAKCAPDDRLRVVGGASGEGGSPRVELAEKAPQPNPLPAKGGEREKRAAAASPTQPNLIMLPRGL